MTVALQVGRIGRPLDTWPVTFGKDRLWRQTFSLPIDVGFIGFVGSASLERVASELRIRPIRIVNAHARLQTPQVLGARRFGPATVYFHDEGVWVEDAGFWTQGRTTIPITIVSNEGVRLRLHTGPVPNSVSLDAGDWREQVDFRPGTNRDFAVPSAGSGTTMVKITTADGFVPARLEESSRDTRFLGSWVEVVHR
jgi:hypothetical protein